MLESQLFKLYHNEQEIKEFKSELKAKNKENDKFESRKQAIEQQLKTRKSENAKLTREMATIEKTIRERVLNIVYKCCK